MMFKLSYVAVIATGIIAGVKLFNSLVDACKDVRSGKYTSWEIVSTDEGRTVAQGQAGS
jgi:1,4-dihydroxy-2-naphthoate octaprenyltransferase